MFEDLLSPLLAKVAGLGSAGPGGLMSMIGNSAPAGAVQALGTPSPGGWGTTVTPEGGTTSPVNQGGIGDAFMANLKSSHAGDTMAKGITSGMNPATPAAPKMSAPSDPTTQSQMGQAGMAGLRAMSRPVGSPGPFSASDPSAGGQPPPGNPMMPGMQQPPSPFMLRRPIY